MKLGFGLLRDAEAWKEKYDTARCGHPRTLGGTLFEALRWRGAFNDYRKLRTSWAWTWRNSLHGSVSIPHDDKCRYISTLAKDVTVLSEVGSMSRAS